MVVDGDDRKECGETRQEGEAKNHETWSVHRVASSATLLSLPYHYFRDLSNPT